MVRLQIMAHGRDRLEALGLTIHMMACAMHQGRLKTSRVGRLWSVEGVVERFPLRPVSSRDKSCYRSHKYCDVSVPYTLHAEIPSWRVWVIRACATPCHYTATLLISSKISSATNLIPRHHVVLNWSTTISGRHKHAENAYQRSIFPFTTSWREMVLVHL